MPTTITIRQVSLSSLLINAPLLSAASLVENAISTVPGAKITKNEAFRIEGEYESSDPAITLPFAITFKNTTPDSNLITLEFRNEDPLPMRTHARATIARAILPDYNPELPAEEESENSGDTMLEAPQPPSASSPAYDAQSGEAAIRHAKEEADYKTTSGLGSFIAAAGWVGVFFSVVGGLVLYETVGFLGLVAGFVAGFFCLLTVATGQLLRAQIEVANNSRLILECLKASHPTLREPHFSPGPVAVSSQPLPPDDRNSPPRWPR